MSATTTCPNSRCPEYGIPKSEVAPLPGVVTVCGACGTAVTTVPEPEADT